jgi:hypothetical protein
MKNLLLLCFIFGFAFAEEASDKIDKFTAFFTSGIFQSALALTLVLCGYVWMFGEGDRGKQYAKNIFVGAFLVTCGSLITDIFA